MSASHCSTIYDCTLEAMRTFVSAAPQKLDYTRRLALSNACSLTCPAMRLQPLPWEID